MLYSALFRLLYVFRGDCCTDVCLSRRRDTENDIQKLKWEVQNKEDKLKQLEKEVQVVFTIQIFGILTRSCVM